MLQSMVLGKFLVKKSKLIAFFSEKLGSAKLNYCIYDLNFYAIVQAIKHWNYYLSYKEFILNTNHEALKHLHNQLSLHKRHAKWVAYLQQFNFCIRHKAGVLNKVAEGLSQRHALLCHMQAVVLGFDVFKEHYMGDNKLQPILAAIKQGNYATYLGFYEKEGFLFKGVQLCVPNFLLRDQLLLEVHNQGWEGYDFIFDAT